MKSQLFKSEVPIDILQDFLANICEKTNHGEYVVSIETFKKGMYFTAGGFILTLILLFV
jgi:hypothetical protein